MDFPKTDTLSFSHPAVQTIDCRYLIFLPCLNIYLQQKVHKRTNVEFIQVLRRMFGPMKDEVTGGWRKLHNEELHSFY
jgi:hypothetical protein